MTDEQSAQDFTIERIVLKDLSFETPMGQTAFAATEQPDCVARLELRKHELAERSWEVVLIATVTARLGADIAFLIEAQQAGVFNVADLEPESVQRILTVDAPQAIFPYLRETVQRVAAQGGFPYVNLEEPPFPGVP